MLTVDKTQRITLKEVLQHPWMSPVQAEGADEANLSETAAEEINEEKKLPPSYNELNTNAIKELGDTTETTTKDYLDSGQAKQVESVAPLDISPRHLKRSLSFEGDGPELKRQNGNQVNTS